MSETIKNDPRGGVFIDSGDGRGPVHVDDVKEEKKEAVTAPSPETADDDFDTEG